MVGEFSFSADKQITFSPDNLQYHPANNEWRFAVSQLDYVGDANSNISATYDGWLDLFGWSTSTTNYGTFGYYDDFYNDFSSSFIDWRTNKIGDDDPNTWHTLSQVFVFHSGGNSITYDGRFNALSICRVKDLQ